MTIISIGVMAHQVVDMAWQSCADMSANIWPSHKLSHNVGDIWCQLIFSQQCHWLTHCRHVANIYNISLTIHVSKSKIFTQCLWMVLLQKLVMHMGNEIWMHITRKMMSGTHKWCGFRYGWTTGWTMQATWGFGEEYRWGMESGSLWIKLMWYSNSFF